MCDLTRLKAQETEPSAGLAAGLVKADEGEGAAAQIPSRLPSVSLPAEQHASMLRSGGPASEMD